jgi:membrane peptidoglycan carboxypeptidase
VIVDEKTQFKEDDGSIFEPENPTHRYHGRITIRDALGNSLNVPPFRTVLAVGVDKIVENAKRFGFSTLDGQYGPSIAIGGVDLTAMDLASAYAMLANGGVVRGVPLNPEASDELSPVAVLSVRDRSGTEIYNSHDHLAEKRVVSEGDAFMITSILSDPKAQCITFGCGGVTVPGYTVAVKTGTSEPFDPEGEDATKIGETWAFGFTRDYVVGIWAGNSDNAPITNIFSTSISFRAMRDTILKAYGERPQTPFEQPKSLEISTACSRAKIGVGCSKDLVLKRDANDPLARSIAQSETDEENKAEKEKDQTAVKDKPSSEAGGGSVVSGEVLATIASPSSGQVSGNTSILGVARSPSLKSFSLELQKPDGSWQALGGGSKSTTGALGTLPAAGLPPGTYTIRLTVTDAAFGIATDSVSVTIE